MSPTEVADLLMDKTNPARPGEGLPQGVMPFFDVGENTYLVVRPQSSKPNRVYWPGGKALIAESLQKFFESLHRNAGFYRQK